MIKFHSVVPGYIGQPDCGVGQLERVFVGPGVSPDHVHGGAGPEDLPRPAVVVERLDRVGVGHVHVVPQVVMRNPVTLVP